jgi:quercetin dioxygenase-like cupin family protein
VLVNNHDPRHLRDEFDTDEPNSFGWEYIEQGPEVWRIRISKLTSTPLPRLLVNTADVIDGDARAHGAASQAMGAVWKLQTRNRDLDSNIIALPAGDGIDAHTGPDLDVLIHVLAGTGELATENGVVELLPGALVWLPRRSRRRFTAGPSGLRYLTVHQRRRSLTLASSAARPVD